METVDLKSLFNPVVLFRALWPNEYIYDKQQDCLYGIRDAAELFVQAGNELGKDYIFGRAALMAFISPWTFFGIEWFDEVERNFGGPDVPEWIGHKRRVITTSVKDKHLDVLWGEIGMAWRTCSVRLDHRFTMTDKEIRFKEEAEAKNAASYMIGVVSGSQNMEALTGHHAPYTFAFGDEASGLDDKAYEATQSWAKRLVMFGNPLRCANKFFKQGCRGGDLMIERADSPLLVSNR